MTGPRPIPSLDQDMIQKFCSFDANTGNLIQYRQSETCLDGFIEERGSILKNAGESSGQNDILQRIQNF